jgi:hypothetical protein
VPPVVLTLLQALFLLLLYVFVGRAVRAIVRDLSPAGAAPPLGRVRTARAERPSRGAAAARRPRRGVELAPAELLVHLPGGATRLLALDDRVEGGGITFGRAPDVTVQIDDPYVSDRHARVYRVDDAWVLADLGSTNGTYHNTSKVTAPVRLVAGDRLAIGRTVVEARR